MDEERLQFSAKLPTFFGPPTAAPIQRVRDVAICVTGAGTVEEFEEHPPIGTPSHLVATGSADRVDLGRGVYIERLSNDDTALVMNACTPRGHNFAPIRQFGQRYSFINDVDHEEWEQTPYRWDADSAIWDALTLSRLIRDNAYSTQYAARIAEYEDGEQVVAYTLAAESKHVYRLRNDRDWLDPSEGAQLRDLMSAYWACEADLPPRVRRAMWRTEYASWIKWGDLVIPTLIGGLEALLKTERHRSTHQFTSRVPQLAQDLAIEGVDAAYCARMYDARSEWVHGAHVRLFTTGQEAQEDPAGPGPQTDEQWNIFTDTAHLQDLLRQALRRCFEDDTFRDTFTDDDLIRARWPT